MARKNDEKLTQNYYINNISKLGQQVFDTKFDKSVELVKQLQKKIDELNIKLSRTKIFEGNNEIRNGEIIGKDILRRMDVNTEIIRKVIDNIKVDNESIVVNLVNGKLFSIKRINNTQK